MIHSNYVQMELLMKLQPLTTETLQREEEFLEKMSDKFKCLIEDREIAIELASSLCNILWSSSRFKDDSHAVSFTFRVSCAIIARLRDQSEDYLDYYFEVKEGVVSDRIKSLMLEIGYYPLTWDDFESERKEPREPRFYIDSEGAVIWQKEKGKDKT